MRSLAGLGAAALAAAILLTATACASSTKAGGKVTHPIRIVMQASDAPDSDANSIYFSKQVQKRSGGRMRIVVASTRYSGADTRNEARLVQALRSGKVQMAYVPSRAWEEASPVTAFRALQAPLLVTNYPLLRRITTGPIGNSMLASLKSIGVVGLGLVPQRLRRLFGTRPLDSAKTLHGAHIRPISSPTSELALRALGAVPMTIRSTRAAGPAMQRGTIVGVESETISIEQNRYMNYAHDLMGNLALFAKTTTIAISKSVLARLSPADRTILRAAAKATVAHAEPAAAERADIPELCRQGVKLVTATPGDLASLERLAPRGSAELERDAATRTEIKEIEQLKETMPQTVSTLPRCPVESTSDQRQKSSRFNGTYVTTVSLAEVKRATGSHGSVDNYGYFRLVLGDGRFKLSDHRAAGEQPVQGSSGGYSAGTYAIHGDRITFTVDSAAGDTPIGSPGDDPVVCRLNLYKDVLTFRQLPPAAKARGRAQGLDPDGPPLLYVNPWQPAPASKSAAPDLGAKIVGTWFVNITLAEKRAAGVENWGPTRLVFGAKRFRISDRRAKGQPLVAGSSAGWTSGTYSIRGNRLTFFIDNGRGDTPLGNRGDPPIVVGWSVYRSTLTLQQGKKNEGGASLWLEPWRRVS
jgi:C4-dicarboxylate-binding protein DctP